MISLFCGCGGSSLGYKWAGFKELLAIDFDDNAIKTFRLNFPEVFCEKWDIINLKGHDILKYCKIKKGQLDVLDGSPPCQGFSSAGKREINDPRNDLVIHYIRLIKEISPKIFIMENVPGMVYGRMKGIFKFYMKEMKKLNYKIKCKMLNAKYYNVPQSRKRLIFIGIRQDIIPDFTDIQFHPYPNKKVITVKQGLKELYDDVHPHNSNDFILNIMYNVPQGKNGSVIKGSGKFFDCIRLHKNKPANTIKKSFRRGMNAYFHPEQDRNLTINELKRIQSFPDDFQFIGPFKKQWARIGNSVPPKMMEAIALHLKKILKKSKGEKAVIKKVKKGG